MKRGRLRRLLAGLASLSVLLGMVSGVWVAATEADPSQAVAHSIARIIGMVFLALGLFGFLVCLVMPRSAKSRDGEG